MCHFPQWITMNLSEIQSPILITIHLPFVSTIVRIHFVLITDMLPAPDVQKQLILETTWRDSQLELSSFAISINWWKSWWDYINIEFDELIKNTNLSCNNTSKVSESNKESLLDGMNPGDESVKDLISGKPLSHF